MSDDDVPGGLAMRAIVERNPFEEAPMEPFWIVTVRFFGRAAMCLMVIVILAVALTRLS